jgi:hypothetical protein
VAEVRLDPVGVVAAVLLEGPGGDVGAGLPLDPALEEVVDGEAAGCSWLASVAIAFSAPRMSTRALKSAAYLSGRAGFGAASKVVEVCFAVSR